MKSLRSKLNKKTVHNSLTTNLKCGKEKTVHKVSFHIDEDGNLRASCTCRVWEKNVMCRHIERVLDGEFDCITFDKSSREDVIGYIRHALHHQQFQGSPPARQMAKPC